MRNNHLMKLLMKRPLLLLLNLIPILLFAQQPVIFPDDFKTSALNGKEVTITNTLTLTNNYSYTYGTLTFSNGQLWTPTEKFEPGADMFNQKNLENQKNQLTVKQGSFPIVDADGTCRIGQTIEGLTGKASYSNGTYTITLTRKPEFKGNERPTSCDTPETYNLKVVSFNLEHFGKNVNTYSLKLPKVALALQALQADIYALVEVEGAAGLEELCQLLNRNCNTQKYKTRYYKDNVQGMACFIYNSDAVTPVGAISLNKLADNYPDVLVVGDLNAYTCEDPIRTLENGGLVNLLTTYAPNQYSYAYFSNGSYAVGYLDHSLATSTLEKQVTDARPFRINADEPQKMDVDQSGVQKDNMYRCSDHSPIVTFLNLGNGSTGIETPTISRPAIRLTGDPRSGYLTLVSNTSLSRAEIVNISGQIIATYDISNAENAENRFTLPVNSLVRGFYLIRVYDAQGRCTRYKAVLP